MNSHHLVEEELMTFDGKRRPDPGGGKRSPNLMEDINSQHLVEEKLTAYGGKKRVRTRWRTEFTQAGGEQELTASD